MRRGALRCGEAWGRIAARRCCPFAAVELQRLPAREAPGGAGGVYAEAPAVAGPLRAARAASSPVRPQGVGPGAVSSPAITGPPVGAAGQCRCSLACSGDLAG